MISNSFVSSPGCLQGPTAVLLYWMQHSGSPHLTVPPPVLGCHQLGPQQSQGQDHLLGPGELGSGIEHLPWDSSSLGGK